MTNVDYRNQKNASLHANPWYRMKERVRHKCAATQHKSPSVSGKPFILALSFFSPSSSLAPSEGQQQLYAGDKSVQQWALSSDWLAQLLRWCEDCRLRLSKGHSAHGCHLVTSLLQMTAWLATLTAQSQEWDVHPSSFDTSECRILLHLRINHRQGTSYILKLRIHCNNKIHSQSLGCL